MKATTPATTAGAFLLGGGAGGAGHVDVGQEFQKRESRKASEQKAVNELMTKVPEATQKSVQAFRSSMSDLFLQYPDTVRIAVSTKNTSRLRLHAAQIDTARNLASALSSAASTPDEKVIWSAMADELWTRRSNIEKDYGF